MRTVVKDLKANQAYNVDLRLSNSTLVSGESLFTCRGGIQLGAIRQVGEDAIRDAVTLAKESDGMRFHVYLLQTLIKTFKPPFWSSA